MVTELNDDAFQKEVLESPEPVLVDFWAPTCGPCRQIAPMIDELAEENAGSVKVVKINTNDNFETPQKYQVMGIPTLLLFKGGEVVERWMGIQPKQRLQEAIDAAK